MGSGLWKHLYYRPNSGGFNLPISMGGKVPESNHGPPRDFWKFSPNLGRELRRGFADDLEISDDGVLNDIRSFETRSALGRGLENPVDSF